MEDSTKNIELLDRFMANEKKSKWWTIINIGIFCVLGLSIFFLAFELKKSNENYKITNKELEKTKDALKIALGQLDKYNNSLRQDSISLTNNLKTTITTKSPPAGKDPVYTVFLQCMPGFEKLMPPLVKDLKEKKYKVPRWEIVEKITFDPVIKYFDQHDSDEAKKLAELINKSNDFFQKNPVKIQKLNLKSPQRQIEIWVGEYRKKNLQQLIKPCPPNC